MAQLRRGARQVLDQILAELTDIDTATELGRAKAVSNPHFTRDRLDEVQLSVSEIRRILREELEPHLERAAPSTERRLAELEAWRAQMEQGSIPNLIRRKAGE